MIVAYQNGVRCTDETSIVEADVSKQNIEKIKMADDTYINIMAIPHIRLNDIDVYYLQQGMDLYLIIRKYDEGFTNLYVINQSVENSQMKIKKIHSVICCYDHNSLLKYCDFNRANEKQNIKSNIHEILNLLPFMSAKEKNYMLEKIDEFFEGNEPRKEFTSIKLESRRGNEIKHITYNGEVFRSLSAFYKKYRINPTTGKKALERGMTPAEVVERYSPMSAKYHRGAGRQPKKYEYAGQEVTIKDLAELSGLTDKTISNRLNQGMTVEQAIEK